MFSQRPACPVCSTLVADWSARCPRCGYHPDCYNRALDDVALVARYRRPAPVAPADGRSGWRRLLPARLRAAGSETGTKRKHGREDRG